MCLSHTLESIGKQPEGSGEQAPGGGISRRGQHIGVGAAARTLAAPGHFDPGGRLTPDLDSDEVLVPIAWQRGSGGPRRVLMRW